MPMLNNHHFTVYKCHANSGEDKIINPFAMPRPDGRGSPVYICGYADACFYLARGSKPRKTPADADTNKQAIANSGKERQETMSNNQFFLPLQFYNSRTKLGRRTRKFTIGFNRA
jgi:hypothetical protein